MMEQFGFSSDVACNSGIVTLEMSKKSETGWVQIDATIGSNGSRILTRLLLSCF